MLQFAYSACHGLKKALSLPSTEVGPLTYLSAYFDVCDLVLTLDGEDEVPGLALGLAHEVAAVLALVHQLFLRLLARDVAVEPSAQTNKQGSR